MCIFLEVYLVESTLYINLRFVMQTVECLTVLQTFRNQEQVYIQNGTTWEVCSHIQA